MRIKPFLKWAGGKRWLLGREEFRVPSFTGRYVEPFLGGGAVFFHLRPASASLSDTNCRLIETYLTIKNNWQEVYLGLARRQELHCRDFYYQERSTTYDCQNDRAAQFIYLNRTCWNGLYRENLNGHFNVPIGTKTQVIFADDSFDEVSSCLSSADIRCRDFEETINEASSGDFIFVDPPYTTAHNFNGFVKYNQTIFSWEDQIRLSHAVKRAADRGCKVAVTNAAHSSVKSLYQDAAEIIELSRSSVICGKADGRQHTTEALILLGFGSQ